MGKILSTELLKNEFDKLIKLNPVVYLELKKFVKVKRYQKSEIIKPINQIDQYARYIHSGYIAKLFPAESGRDYRVRIFSKGTVACDFESFYKEKLTGFYLQALSYVSVFEIKKNDVDKVIEVSHDFSKLAAKINNLIHMQAETWNHIRELPLEEGYQVLKNNFPNELQFLSKKDLAFFFNTSIYQVNKSIE